MMTFKRQIDSRPPLYSTNYPLRIFVSVRAIAIALVALFEADSLTHELLIRGEFVALLVMAALVATGACGVFDAVVNDLLPRRFVLRWAAADRHLLFLGIAGFYLSFAFVAVTHGYLGLALLVYGLDATAAIWIAIYHIRHRYLVPRKTREQQWASGR